MKLWDSMLWLDYRAEGVGVNEIQNVKNFKNGIKCVNGNVESCGRASCQNDKISPTEKQFITLKDGV